MKRTREQAFGVSKRTKEVKRLRLNAHELRLPEANQRHSPRLTSEERQILRSKREVEEIKEQRSRWAHFYETKILNCSVKLNSFDLRAKAESKVEL